jgi:hypothetical protein
MSTKKFNNLSKNTEQLQSGLSSLLGVSKSSEKQSEITQSLEKKVKYIRHTVLFDPQDLEFIKDFVYYKRINGEVEYTQKEALEEAIKLLREAHKDVNDRPK